MRPGELVTLNNRGQPVRVVPEEHPTPLSSVREFSPGTLAMILEIGYVGKDGPSMETYAKVMVGGNFVGFVWLAECEEIREDR